MKTERRHELQTNVLADWLGRTIENVRPYSTGIVGGVVLLVVVFGAFTYWQSQTRTNQRQGWEQLLAFTVGSNTQNLENVADQFPQTPVGDLARLQLGNLYLHSGITQLFTDRAEGKNEIRKAVDAFEIVLKDASDPLLQQHATYGLARAHESLNQLQEAEKYYQELQDKWSDGVYSNMARRRLADLGRQETREFYDWFESQEPAISITGGPGQPGTRLPFDPDSLPDEPGDHSPFDLDLDTSPTDPSPEPSDEPKSEEPTDEPSEESTEESTEEPSADDSDDEAPSEQPSEETPADETTEGETSTTDETSTEGDSPPTSPEEPEESSPKPE